MVHTKKRTANIWEYKVGIIANFERLWKILVSQPSSQKDTLLVGTVTLYFAVYYC